MTDQTFPPDDVADELRRRLRHLKNEVSETLGRCRREFEAAAEDASARRSQDLSDLRESVDRLLREAAEERKKSSRDDADARRAFVTDVRVRVDDLLTESRDRRRTASRVDTASRRDAVAAIRKEVADWLSRSNTPSAQTHSADEARPEETSAPDDAPEAGSPAGEAAADGGRPGSDDLTEISGIGKGIAARLAASGIETFSTLAALEPDEVRRVLGSLGSMSRVDAWIAEATRRSS